MNNSKEVHDKEFTGYWISRDVVSLFERGEINLKEMFLVAIIDSYTNPKKDGCYASNKFLGDLIGVNAKSVSSMITKLKNLGVLIQTGFDGRRRYLRANWTLIKSGKPLNRLPENQEADYRKIGSLSTEKSVGRIPKNQDQEVKGRNKAEKQRTSSKTSSSQKRVNGDSRGVRKNGFFDEEDRWVNEQATILRQILVAADSSLVKRRKVKGVYHNAAKTESFEKSIASLLEIGIPKSQIESVLAWLTKNYGKDKVPEIFTKTDFSDKWDRFRSAYKRYQNSLSKDHSAFNYDPDKDPNELVREWIDDNYDEYDIDDSSAVIEEHMIEAGCKALGIKRGKVTLM